MRPSLCVDTGRSLLRHFEGDRCLAQAHSKVPVGVRLLHVLSLGLASGSEPDLAAQDTGKAQALLALR